MPFTDADLDGMLGAVGEIVTLGATSVYGVIRAVDPTQFQQSPSAGLTTAMVVRALLVTVRDGALPTLNGGSLVILRGDHYIVDQVVRTADGRLVNFVVYPTPQAFTQALADGLTLADGIL